MLASGSAWRILEAEHDQLRRLLEAIMRKLEVGPGKRPGLDLGSLRAQIQEFQDFETRTHRPKGVVLLESVRGRSADADRLLDEIEDESRTCEQLLSRAVALVEKGLTAGDADRRLDEIEDESRTCEQLLSQAVVLIEKGLAGGAVDQSEIDSLLRRHRDLMVQQLDQEDTALRSYTTQLLTSQEWSRVASSISSEVQKAKGRRDATRN